MSYDLKVWSATAIDLPHALPDSDRWHGTGDEFVWLGDGWQVVVGPQHRVDVEDVPHEAHAIVPGIRSVTELRLEPLGAPLIAYELLYRVSEALASSSHGVVGDWQTAEVADAAGRSRPMTVPAGRVLNALQLSWFSIEPSIRSRSWLDSLVSCLEAGLPEALPVRYGEYEPPKYRLRETSREHFVDFLTTQCAQPREPGSASWQTKGPVLDVALALGSGPSWQGWRCCRLTMTLEAAALEQPGWSSRLPPMWRSIAHLMRAFYADVRTLASYRPDGGTSAEILAADQHPVCSWFWAGIPAVGGHAAALGPPYVALWPEFQRAAEIDGELLFLCEEDWRNSGADVFIRVGGVPHTLATQRSGYAPGQVGPNHERTYPPVWPFGSTHVK